MAASGGKKRLHRVSAVKHVVREWVSGTWSVPRPRLSIYFISPLNPVCWPRRHFVNFSFVGGNLAQPWNWNFLLFHRVQFQKSWQLITLQSCSPDSQMCFWIKKCLRCFGATENIISFHLDRWDDKKINNKQNKKNADLHWQWLFYSYGRAIPWIWNSLS